MAGSFLKRLTRLPLTLCLVFGIAFSVGMVGNPSTARAGCCFCCPWSIATITGGSTLLNGLRDQIVSMLTSNFNTLFSLAFGDTESNSGKVLNTQERNLDATRISNSDRLNSQEYSVRVKEAVAKDVSVDYTPAQTVCLGMIQRRDAQASAKQATAKRATLAAASTNYLSGRSALTNKGATATTAAQFNRISSQFFDPAWKCPTGMTCNAAPSAYSGTVATKNLDPAAAVFGGDTHQIDVGTNDEKAAQMWVDLVSLPVPPTAVKGDQLALPAARTLLRVGRADTLAVNVQRAVINESLASRMVDSSASDGPSVVSRLYTSLADAEAKNKAAAMMAQDSEKANIQAISVEVDRMNYAYWQLFQRLEKIALMKALQIKAKLESDSGVMDNNALTTLQRT